MPTNPTELHYTVVAMRAHGGNFCQHLADAWLSADPSNRKRLQDAFPHLFEQYGPQSRFYTLNA